MENADQALPAMINEFLPIGLNQTSNYSPTTTTNHESPSTRQDNISTVQEYRELTFLPFDFRFSVPSDWVVTFEYIL